jgi:hypothetical protein
MPGEEYNNKTVLVERIRSMSLVLLGESEDTALYYNRLPGNSWWPGPDIGTLKDLRSLPKEELREIYDKMRVAFVGTETPDQVVVQDVVQGVVQGVVEEIEHQVEEPEREAIKSMNTSNGMVAKPLLRAAFMHCDNEYDRKALKLSGNEHSSASLLRDLIRHMALDILNRPKESSRVPYKELKEKLWWPAPEVSSRIGLWMLSLERLQGIYDDLRRYFV